MKRTILVTHSFLSLSYISFHFFLHLLAQPSVVQQIQVSELCRIGVYRYVLGSVS